MAGEEVRIRTEGHCRSAPVGQTVNEEIRMLSATLHSIMKVSCQWFSEGTEDADVPDDPPAGSGP